MLKKSGFILKKSSLKKKSTLKKTRFSSSKYKSDNIPIDKNSQIGKVVKMWDFFLEIWKERPHFSEVSGKYLGNEPKSWMFDHLLEKSRYPQLAYEKENIVLVTFDEHERKTNGHPLPKHQEFINNLKNKLQNYD